jgi:hypothetical protein
MRGLMFASFALVACIGAEDGKGPEDELPPDDSKEDSHRKPTDHGVIAFGEKALSSLTDGEKFHAWEFELSGPATVTVTTSYAIKGQRKTDTVLYMYEFGLTGPTWGSYIARNDDYDGKVYSQLVMELDAGRYRSLVKGFAAATRGKFSITVNCTGIGCQPPAPAGECVFGSTYFELPDQPGLEITGRIKITPANLDTLSAQDQHKLMLAVQQSSHTDVTTPAEALSRVDQQEMNVVFIFEPAARRMFQAFEYGAGDNSYGAIFERWSTRMVTNIHDGDLENCATQAETCLLPEDWLAMRNDPAFTRTGTVVVTQASQLDALGTQQALEVFSHSFEDVTSVADGLSRVDDNRLNLVSFTHVATGRQLTVAEYGAGDTSVGGVFFQGGTELAGRINDLTIEACAFFVE